jgi:hypothetical protein
VLKHDQAGKEDEEARAASKPIPTSSVLWEGLLSGTASELTPVPKLLSPRFGTDAVTPRSVPIPKRAPSSSHWYWASSSSALSDRNRIYILFSLLPETGSRGGTYSSTHACRNPIASETCDAKQPLLSYLSNSYPHLSMCDVCVDAWTAGYVATT